MLAKTEGTLIPEKINIISTQIVKFNIDSPFDFLIQNIEGHNYNLDFELAFNLDDSLVKADLIINVSTISKAEVENESAGEFHIVYVFQVDNLNELVITDDNNEISLNGGLGNALASITYSTSRGILLARLKGTGLGNFVLPVIDPNSLLKK